MTDRFIICHGEKKRRAFDWARHFLVVCLHASIPILLCQNFMHMNAFAQDIENSLGISINENAPMLLEADELLYNDNENTITAQGNVQIYYDGYTVEAKRIIYHQESARVVARGNVRMTEPTGNIIYAKEIDLTDNFSDGFIQSLHVETPQKTRFAAASAERHANNTTIFNKGVYTACKACKKNPHKAPLWQVKARKIRHDQERKIISYQHAKIEFWGIPIAYLPYFHHPDPTVKRKTGFLAPQYIYSNKIGLGLSAPYFIALAPNYDITLRPVILSKQGILADIEYRHRFENGSISIRANGLHQRSREQFSGTPGDRDFRGGFFSTGTFHITNRWKWGWQLITSTDSAYFRDYKFSKWDETTAESNLYLTGLSERNYFDTRLNHFGVLRDEAQSKQSNIRPLVDYDYIFAPTILGGEASFAFNLTSLSRKTADVKTSFMDIKNNQTYMVDSPIFWGLKGNYTRTSLNLKWRRRLLAPGGQVITPFGSLRGDIYQFKLSKAQLLPSEIDNAQQTFFSAMPMAGLEYRWPILVTNKWGAQVFEPIAQILIRPNELNSGKIPNEDSQSLVYDETNLFHWNKFSGFDRTEGGTRLNLGLRYSAQLTNGGYINALIGQSFQLAGKNPYSSNDLMRIGIDSGLETDHSDYVAAFSTLPISILQIGMRGRFDEKTLALKRGEVQATAQLWRANARINYAFFRNSRQTGHPNNRSEVASALNFRLSENWLTHGELRYDLSNHSLVEYSLGLAYHNECFLFSITYNQTLDRYNDIKTGHTVKARFELKTIAEGEIKANSDFSSGN